MTSRRVVIPLYFPAVCLAARAHEAVPQLRRQLQTRQPPGQAGEAELELQRLLGAVLRQPHEEDAKAAPFGETPQAAQVRGGEKAAGLEESAPADFSFGAASCLRRPRQPPRMSSTIACGET